MTEAKRYDMEYVDFHSEMVECESGEYVRHKDYALLQSRLESLEKDAASREDVARAIWNVMREYEDRCDMELEDMGAKHPIWEYADAAMQARKGVSE